MKSEDINVDNKGNENGIGKMLLIDDPDEFQEALDNMKAKDFFRIAAPREYHDCAFFDKIDNLSADLKCAKRLADKLTKENSELREQIYKLRVNGDENA